MASNQKIQFKNPQQAITWLETALRSEQAKFKQCPVLPDLVPGFEAANAWGYVVPGYFLIEESFKELLYLRGVTVPQKHSLTILFDLLSPADQAILREYYSDYRSAIGGYRGSFPFNTLDEFLKNLDGNQNSSGKDYVGSFDWRYFPIEESKSQQLPFISIDYLHEVAYGCIEILKYIHYRLGHAGDFKLSLRMHRGRSEKYNSWLTLRINSEDWGTLPDRIEILWGPDYQNRYDLLVVKGGSCSIRFSVLPENPSLQVDDKRNEVEEFDARQD